MKNILSTLFLLGLFGLAVGQTNPTKTIMGTPAGTGTTTWYSDTTYILDGFVFVNDGDTLTIQPGTVIKGMPGQGASASAFIVARGAYLDAQGQRAAPIIFTASSDDTDNPIDIAANQTGLWGGVIILGNATTNTVPPEQAIEGIPTTETRGLFGTIDPNGDGDFSDGVSDDSDNSGIMTYISVRHGGTNIGAGNEINGFTMGGVGSGTTIDHIEVIFNQDDGFEWFGGTVNCSHLSAAFCGDDSYDYDMGWRGNVQFAFAIQSPDAGSDRIGEHDGGTSPETNTPFATPKFFNVTYIGRGDTDGDRMLTFRDNAGGEYHNSIFVEQDRGVDFEILGNGSVHSFDRLEAGDLKIENNIWWNVAANDVNDIWTVSLQKYGTNLADSLADLAAGTDSVRARLLRTGQEVVDPGFLIDRDDFAKGLDPRPRADEAITNPTLTPVPNDPFFETVTYKGAFSPEVSEFWLRRWTYMEQLEYFPDQLGTITSGARPEKVILGTSAGTGTTTWSKDTTYLLDGFVFVNDGDTLEIQAGTIVKGLPGQGADASALIVARGGYILAEGTRAEPIIFTASSDDTDNPIDVAENETGLWGGVIILGNATTNTVPPEQAIEGIPTTEVRGLFGTIDPNGDGDFSDGISDDADNSGILTYISIRHGGTNIGAGNEINGFTMGGVGSGTTIDHIEVMFNQDDGFEWFGGTVNCSHLIAGFCGDDSYDYDMGWRGNVQFALALQSPDAGSDRIGEHDGGTSPETNTPFATPKFYNVTYIGRGDSDGDRMLTFRDNAGGEYHNSIFVEQDRGVDFEILGNGSTHSFDRLIAGELKIENSIWWNVADNDPNDIWTVSLQKFSGNVADSTAELARGTDSVRAILLRTGQEVVDPGMLIDREAFAKGLDPRGRVNEAINPSVLSPVPNDPFFETVDYKGAFAPEVAEFWADRWTYLDELEYFPDQFATIVGPTPEKVILGTSAGTGTTTWFKDTTYILDGFVFVNDGDSLTIQSGTVIKGLPGQGADASALIVARGGYIDAQGTKSEPIIFTASSDDVNNPFDVAENENGLWGGVIVLGNATTNTVPPEQAIEGIPTTEVRGLFGTIDPNGDGDFSDGVSDDADNSGIMTYISIRHGGTNIGAGNEINGFTMGGVGSGTTIDHIEVIFNQDDGFEWFGGTVNCSHLVAAFCGDDSYDYDMGWRGNVQFAFAIQSEDAGSDRIGEHDGGTSPETNTPFATPKFFNVTYIGRGDDDGDRMLTFRDNAGGEYHNSIFAEQDRGVDFEILGNGSTHSFDRLIAGELKIENNLWWNVAENDPNNIWTVSLQKFDGNVADSTAELARGTDSVQAILLRTGQIVADPGFGGLDREAFANGLDPRPTSGAAIFGPTMTPVPNDPFFTEVDYLGAFNNTAEDFWLDGWTALHHMDYLPDPLQTLTSVRETDKIQEVKLYPNPTRGLFTIEATDLTPEMVKINVFDISGRMVYEAEEQPFGGEIRTRINLTAEATGMYFVKVQQGEKLAIGQLVLQ